MNTLEIIVPQSAALSIALGFAVVVTVIRIVRWVLDILP